VEIPSAGAFGKSGAFPRPIEPSAAPRPRRGFLSDRVPATYLGGWMTPPLVLDRTALERLQRLGGSALVRQMLGLFREGALQRLAAAREAQEAGDRTALARAAHALVGSAGNVGAAELMARARALEEAARAGSPDLSGLLAELEAAHERFGGPLAETERELAG
jgi:HPt (histidine-containing phosphotransfer) domain-containing protein